ncbi:MAG: exo-alpha-sialidase [Ignavibacteria bacterium]|nr:exo-alpha-sialidase [Ignavibacteria bacterium]
MKKYFLLSVIILSAVIFMGQKSQDDDPRWNNPRTPAMMSGDYSPLPYTGNDIKQFTYSPRINITPIGVLTTFPNVRVLPSTATVQSEVIIVRNPNNPSFLFGSSNASRSSFINSGSYRSTDGGLTWIGSDSINAPNFNDQRGDPGPTIDKNNTILFTHLTSNTNFGGVTGMGANYSTDNGQTWSATYQVVNDGSADKNLAGTDDSPTSPFYGNSYFAWTSFSSSPANGRASRTTNSGVTWETPEIINATPSGHNAQGHDVAVGPDGNVFVVWTAGVTSAPFTEDFVGVAKSTNGGVSYTATENAFDVNGSRSTSFNGWGIRTNGFPRIAIDKTNGSRRGWIYVVTSQLNLPPAGSDADVILRRSTDNGVTWSAGVRVNQDALNNGKVQFFPAVCVDDAGGVNIVYYDNRDFPSSGDSCSVFISRSIDGGFTFTDVEVADHHFRPKPASGLGGGYMGDYIGIAASVGKVVAIWADDKAGASSFYNAWTGAMQIVTYPLNVFNLQSPPSGARVVSFPNSNSPINISWDTSASTASYKWIFGSPTTNPRILTLPSSTNLLTLTAGALDNALAGIGLAQGDSLVGQWDVWAFRNDQNNDSLKAANGPRAITLKRGVPELTTFNLSSPPSGTTITTSPFNTSTININWSRSGQGTTYKWKFGSPTIGTVVLTLPSNAGGYDSTLSFTNFGLDGILAGLGLNPGDSAVGQWSVWAYNANDSLKASQNFALTLKRQSRGDILIMYDSTVTNCRISRDSVISNLNTLSATYDLFNKRGNTTGTTSISLRGYKTVMLLGEGTSLMSNVVKDSIKSYLASGTSTVKSRLIIFSEDVGYNLDRTGSTFFGYCICKKYSRIPIHGGQTRHRNNWIKRSYS